MNREVLGRCPVCGAGTEITRISCLNCNTTIEGHFQVCKFCRLTQEQKAFIDVFIKCRGNIKEVEKELGVSYPTVKNRLDEAIRALGYEAENDGEKQPADRMEILERLNKGEITVDEAVELLKDGF